MFYRCQDCPQFQKPQLHAGSNNLGCSFGREHIFRFSQGLVSWLFDLLFLVPGRSLGAFLYRTFRHWMQGAHQSVSLPGSLFLLQLHCCPLCCRCPLLLPPLSQRIQEQSTVPCLNIVCGTYRPVLFCLRRRTLMLSYAEGKFRRKNHYILPRRWSMTSVHQLETIVHLEEKARLSIWKGQIHQIKYQRWVNSVLMTEYE